ncbi:MAG TPA: 23S rRNA (guanosine(2251)-2'-O)-methyltransferase RlmB [Solirubrobacteraceae bacterium]|nr:23S rRNA (guanosine(2251)-2'-O)-methyltransferase RlmB [Solirubrobacteraceae bacterium]
MIVYGRNPVREALRGRRRDQVGQVWATEGAAREPWLSGLDPVPARPEELERLCGSRAHQGVCAEVGPYPYVDADELVGADGLVLALDRVQDPQNLGAICRTAECAGARGLVLPERRSVEITPAACKASAGAVEHLAVAQVGNLSDFLSHAKRQGAWCYGAAATGGRPYTAVDFGPRVVLVLGGEGGGLGRRVAASCDELVTIPLRGRLESLNVGAAAAVLVYAILQHADPARPALDRGS